MAMTARKSTTPAYVWPEYSDDPTLGGAITVEMHDALQASATPGEPLEPNDPPES